MSINGISQNELAGYVVKSKAGRDRYRIFFVIAAYVTDSGINLELADGERRKLSFPKKKNMKHVTLMFSDAETARAIKENSVSDEMIRTRLAGFDRLEDKMQGGFGQ